MSSIHKIDDHEASLEYWGTNLFSQHMTEFTSYVLDKDCYQV